MMIGSVPNCSPPAKCTCPYSRAIPALDQSRAANDGCAQESKPRPRLSRLRSSDYGGNIRRYNFRNSAANKRVFFFPG